MAHFLTAWEPQPHGGLVELAEGLLTVEGDIRMPLGNFPRRMVVAALAGGGTAVWSAIALREPEMKVVEALGEPRWLIVPGVAHRRDAFVWAQRYPAMKVLCAPGAARAVAEIVPVDATEDPFADADVRFEVVPGVDEKEAALLVRRRGQLTLVLNDILANVRHPRGLGAKVMARLMGFGADRPRMPWVARRMFVKDKVALADAFRRWAARPDLAQIVPSHGDVIAEEPMRVLLRIAAELEA